MTRRLTVRPPFRPALAAAIAISALVLAACGEPSDTRLATMCIDASGDNRARHSASLASRSEVDVDGDRIEIRIGVPVGISIGGELKFKHRTFRCVREGDDVRLVEAIYH